LVVVELLSPGTEAEGLGVNVRSEDLIQTPVEGASPSQEAQQSCETGKANRLASGMCMSAACVFLTMLC